MQAEIPSTPRRTAPRPLHPAFLIFCEAVFFAAIIVQLLVVVPGVENSLKEFGYRIPPVTLALFKTAHFYRQVCLSSAAAAVIVACVLGGLLELVTWWWPRRQTKCLILLVVNALLFAPLIWPLVRVIGGLNIA